MAGLHEGQAFGLGARDELDRGMDERPKRATHNSHSDVHEPETDTNPEHIARKAEDEGATGESRSPAGKRYAVGRAADDTVEQHDIGILDTLQALENVGDAERGPFLDPALSSELASVWLPGRNELHDLPLCRSAAEQLGLQRSDSPSDLEHAGSVEPAHGCRSDHPSLEIVQAFLAMPLEALARQARLEDLLARPGAAAARHDATIASRASNTMKL